MFELVIWYLAGLLIWAVFTILIYKSVCLRTQKKWPRRLALAIMILIPTWDVAFSLALYKPVCIAWDKFEFNGVCSELSGNECLNTSFSLPELPGDEKCPYSVGRSEYKFQRLVLVNIEYHDTRCGMESGRWRYAYVESYFPGYLIPFFSWLINSEGVLFSCGRNRYSEVAKTLANGG